MRRRHSPPSNFTSYLTMELQPPEVSYVPTQKPRFWIRSSLELASSPVVKESFSPKKKKKKAQPSIYLLLEKFYYSFQSGYSHFSVFRLWNFPRLPCLGISGPLLMRGVKPKSSLTMKMGDVGFHLWPSLFSDLDSLALPSQGSGTLIPLVVTSSC